MIELQAELRKLKPVELPEVATAEEPGLPSGTLDELTRGLLRLAKHQFRGAQSAEAVAEACRQATAEARELASRLREEADEHRRTAAKVTEARRSDAVRLLAIVDAVDDVTVVARQMGDARWIERLERLASRLLQTLAGIGLSEIPARGNPFDEELHEALETVPPTPDSRPGIVHEVVSRGFLYEGKVVRRVQVITTR